ncbi:MAG: hypothetical protein QM667_02635 [Asticcacaulis sp.]
MKRQFFPAAAAAALMLCALAPTVTQAQALKTFVAIEKPAEGAPLLIVTPEVSLSLLTAGGIQEPRSDWSKAAQGHLSTAMTTALKGKKYAVSEVALDTYDDPRALQMLKLNDEVVSAIVMQSMPALRLPTKTTFDWTLGDGVQVLVPASMSANAPHYALFLHCKGSYQSSAKAALNVGMALLGGPMQFGGQGLQATLVDLRTGQVVWYQFSMVASGTDIREAEGATAAVEKLFKDLPL